MEAVDVLVGIDGVEHALRRVLSHRRRQRRLHEDAVVRDAAVQAIDEGQQVVERGGRRQPLQVDPQSGVGAGLHLVADVDFGRRILADEHDAEAGRASRPGREGLHRGRRRRTDRRADRRAVK
jgi:hypothetical protein